MRRPATTDTTTWDERYRGEGYRYGCEPNDWLVAHTGILPTAGQALDLACGEGRDAVFLATRGLTVEAIDGSAVALAKGRQLAAARAATVTWRHLNLEGGWLPERHTYALITCHNFLHRPLLAALPDALTPGGILIYATYLTGQERYGHPANPAHLLRPGELRQACTGLEILAYQEGTTRCCGQPAMRAAVVARKTPAEEPK